MYFIYNQYSCEESLREAGFDIDEVKQFLCQDEIENLKAEVYAATEDRDCYEWKCDQYNSEINEMVELLYEIKNDLEAGRKTKAQLADKIRSFLEQFKRKFLTLDLKLCYNIIIEGNERWIDGF